MYLVMLLLRRPRSRCSVELWKLLAPVRPYVLTGDLHLLGLVMNARHIDWWTSVMDRRRLGWWTWSDWNCTYWPVNLAPILLGPSLKLSHTYLWVINDVS